MAKDDQQYVNILFPPDLLQKVDDFRFANRIASRNEAVRWLLQWALAQKPKPPK